MPRTVVIDKETNEFIGVAENKEGLKFLLGERAEDTVNLITSKNFEASEQYATFKDLYTAAKPKDESAGDEQGGDTGGEDIAAAGANKTKRSSSIKLEGAYHLTKALPPCADDHPKKPIWDAIANNTTVEDAKAACPAVNPPRKTNGVYTFASEFRYFLKTGYAVMGEAPAADEAGEAQTDGTEAQETEEAAA